MYITFIRHFYGLRKNKVTSSSKKCDNPSVILHPSPSFTRISFILAIASSYFLFRALFVPPIRVSLSILISECALRSEYHGRELLY